MRRPRDLALRVVLPLLVFAAAELGARDLIDLRSWIGTAERRSLAAYRDEPWAGRYFTDLLACQQQTRRRGQARYVPYLLQDINEDCRTPTVNYTGRVRHTWRLPDTPATPPFQLAVFGGSTVEGVGVIDDETIPSHVARIAASDPDTASPSPLEVTNYGVSSYTFTQSVFKLITLLRDGRHIDGVIFYGGANDIDYAYQYGVAGALYEEDVVETRVEGRLWDRARLWGREQINACVLCLGAAVIVRHVPGVSGYVMPRLVRLRDWLLFKKGASGPDDVEPLARSIAAYYVRSHVLLAHLSAAYHFQYLDVWQPSLMYEDGYAPGEAMLAHLDPRLTDSKLRRLYAATHADLLAAHLTHFQDLSHALDDRRAAAYFDAVHVNGQANRTIARAILQAWDQIVTSALPSP
jgi:lysophospholipase L1-like esterase